MAMAYELLCKRWTIIILRELHLGSSKFNQIKCGVPRISPTLLSRRLKELEADGLLKIHRNPDNKKNTKNLKRISAGSKMVLMTQNSFCKLYETN
jgi:DNA-binding HxlR family transcriptional regulator